MNSEPERAPAQPKTTKAECDGCGRTGGWTMVADDQWALLKLHDGDTLDLRTGPSEVLAVRAVACQHCGYLRLYDARYI